MASLNDFKVIKSKCRSYYNALVKEYPAVKKNLEEKKSHENYLIESEKIGFYLFILELTTNNKDVSELVKMVTDTEFNSLVLNQNNEDLGIDAVYIDEERRLIQLYTFKYRNNFKEDSGMSSSVIESASPFLTLLQSEIETKNNKKVRSKTETYIDEICSAFDSDSVWTTELIAVSNEVQGINRKEQKISVFEKNYGMEIKDIDLDKITAYLSDKPKNVEAEFIIDKRSMLSYESDDYSSAKSYLLRMNLATLIRITNTDSKYRGNSSLENFNDLQGLELESGLLYDNVRGYLGDTKYNKNIINTLLEEPRNFFMYNNGLTMTVGDISSEPINGGAKYKFKIKDFQVVNGGQTLRTIYHFNENDFNDNVINDAEVLIRLFQTSDNAVLTNNIAEYTNSQNAISSSDLKSISNEQIQIEKYLSGQNIEYIRKVGKRNSNEDVKNISISMEHLAQVLYSYICEQPSRATTQKKKLFETYYDEIFKSKNFDLDILPDLINLESQITSVYVQLGLESTKQKNLYVLYIVKKLNDDPIIHNKEVTQKEIEDSVQKLEEILRNYVAEQEDISPARALIKNSFKEELDKALSKSEV